MAGIGVVIPVGYAHAAVAVLRDGDPEEMFFTFGVATGSEDTTASDIALAVAATFTGGIPTPIHFTRVLAYVAKEGDVPEVQEAALAISSTGPATLAPQNCAVLYRKHTTHGGRRGRGRFFLPWVGEGDVDNVGVLSTGSKALYQAYGDQLLSNLAGTTHGASTPMVLLHRPGASLLPLPYIVSGMSVDNVIATQRQRMRK